MARQRHPPAILLVFSTPRRAGLFPSFAITSSGRGCTSYGSRRGARQNRPGPGITLTVTTADRQRTSVLPSARPRRCSGPGSFRHASLLTSVSRSTSRISALGFGRIGRPQRPSRSYFSAASSVRSQPRSRIPSACVSAASRQPFFCCASATSREPSTSSERRRAAASTYCGRVRAPLVLLLCRRPISLAASRPAWASFESLLTSSSGS